MGTHTLLRLNVTLTNSLPADVVAALIYLTTDADDEKDEFQEPPSVLPKHPFFECESWSAVLLGQSAYHPATLDTHPVFVQGDDGWSLQSCAAFTNYQSEIRLFCDFIGPYLKVPPGDEIGAIRYEGSEYDNVSLLYDGLRIVELERSEPVRYDGSGEVSYNGCGVPTLDAN
ncbi:hypothetical protein LPN04_31140 [Rugamonas sp. A1-17]|nr:hypothetical protein [Rugamonas sp. A1-17]